MRAPYLLRRFGWWLRGGWRRSVHDGFDLPPPAPWGTHLRVSALGYTVAVLVPDDATADYVEVAALLSDEHMREGLGVLPRERTWSTVKLPPLVAGDTDE